MNTTNLPSRIASHVITAMRQQSKLAAHFHFGAIVTLVELGLIEEAMFHDVKIPSLT
jgi:hypothetical protein